MSHTAMPWVVSEGMLFVHAKVDGNPEIICDLENPGPFSTVERRANANLIAAAPELLKALKYARRFLTRVDHDVTMVDAVIAKAEGNVKV